MAGQHWEDRDERTLLMTALLMEGVDPREARRSVYGREPWLAILTAAIIFAAVITAACWRWA